MATILYFICMVHTVTCWIWPFVFVCNLINALRPSEVALMISRKASTIWAGVALMMMTAVPYMMQWLSLLNG